MCMFLYVCVTIGTHTDIYIYICIYLFSYLFIYTAYRDRYILITRFSLSQVGGDKKNAKFEWDKGDNLLEFRRDNSIC